MIRRSNGVESTRYPVWRLAIAHAALLLVAFAPYLFGGRTFLPMDIFDSMTAPFNATYGPAQGENIYPIDGVVQTYPYKVETQRALLTGHIAHWDSHIYGGYPVYAETMGNNFDVFNVGLLWLDVTTYIHLQTLLELFIAGLGMIVLLRYFGVSEWSNVIFSTAYALNSLFIASALHRWTVASFCWMPFVLLFALRSLKDVRNSDLLFAAIFLALAFFGGNLQSAFFASSLLAGIVLLQPREIGFRRKIVAVGSIGLLAFAMSAIMWLPTLELFLRTLQDGSLNSSSVYAKYSLAQRFLSLPLLIIFFFPSAAGNPESFSLKKIAGADVLDFNGALGFVPMLFAVLGVVMLWKQREMRSFIMVGLVAILLPIFTPLFHILYHRFFILATFCFTVVGACAFDQFLISGLSRSALAMARRGLSMIILVFVFLCAACAMFRDAIAARLHQQLAQALYNTAFGAGNEEWMFQRISKTLDFFSFHSLGLWLPILLAVVALGAIHQYASRRTKFALAIIAICSTAQLLQFFWFWMPNVDSTRFPTFPKSPITTFLAQHASEGRFAVFRDSTKDATILRSNIASIYGMSDFSGYESLSPASMALAAHNRENHTLAGPDIANIPLRRRSNVRYIVTGAIQIADTNIRPVVRAQRLTIYEDQLAKPRAYLASRLLLVPTKRELIDSIASPNQPLNAVFAIDGDMPRMISHVYDTSGGVTVTRSSDELVEVDVNAKAPGLLILTDAYYPGWKCLVNGQDRKIYRVNYAMRGVEVPAGHSDLIFKFEPGLFTAGEGLSALAWAAVVAALVVMRRKER